MLLEFEGYVVSFCESGACAADLIREKCFDVLLIAYRMPEMNGNEVVRLLRPRCPQALMIGFSVESKEQDFIKAGADAFVGKRELVRKLLPLIKNKMLR